MKILLIVLGIIYLGITVLVFIIQTAISILIGSDSDQSKLMNPFDLLKQAFQWPIILIKFIVR